MTSAVSALKFCLAAFLMLWSLMANTALGSQLTLLTGGMNPYVVPIAGAPWAAYLSDRLLAASWNWHFRVRGEVEVGPFADAVLLSDRSRTGGSENGWLGGIGLLFDGRFDRAQFDARAGWNPDPGQFSLFLSAGYLWE
jgi:hypothetical protein